MNYDIEHTHSIETPKEAFEFLAEHLPDRNQISYDTLQFQYSDSHYLRFWCPTIDRK